MAESFQSLLRFLTQEAKLPLTLAMASVKSLQARSLTTPESLAKAKPTDLSPLFPEEKQVKQIISAAKRVSKKRAAESDDTAASSSKRKKQRDEGSFFSTDAQSAAELEASLQLPYSEATAEKLGDVTILTNRAPLVLAFVVVLLKYTMPGQPLSSRLSLAQAYVSVNSRAKAMGLGLEKGISAEEEGVGDGQPVVRVAGREVKVVRRWGYEVDDGAGGGDTEGESKDSGEKNESGGDSEVKGGDADSEPPLWALDLEALRKSNCSNALLASATGGRTSGLPIYTPQSARSYIMRAFETASKGNEEGPPKKKPTAAVKMAEKEKNLGMLLRAIDLLYLSWLDGFDPEELNRRVWSWYVKVRPDVENGVAGWGGKGEVKLLEILALRRDAT